MKIYTYSDKELASQAASWEIAKLIHNNPKAVIGLATGSTMSDLYDSLSQQSKNLDFSQITTFNLDEYFPISSEHIQSYHYFMNIHLFNNINIKRDNINFPNEKQNYENLIAKVGGIDLQLLGIGNNAHIAFNEPGSSKNSLTRRVDLTPETIKANSRFFDSIDLVPKQAYSMGLKTIFEAKKIILLAFGESKAKAIKEMVDNKIFNNKIPASLLNEHHDVTIYLDEAAASLLNPLSYRRR